MKLAQVVDRFDQTRYMAIVSRILTRAGVVVDGQPLWIAPDVFWDCDWPGAITVGDRCVISRQVVLLTHDFSLDRVAEAKLGRSDRELTYRGAVSIGALAFLGLGTIVMPGVSIGRGAIVGAGSVVTKDVPPDTVVAGNPARVLGTTDDYWARSLARFEWQDRR